MIPVIKSLTPPDNVNTIWIDIQEMSLKIFGPNGWEPISAISEEQVKQLELIKETLDSVLNEDTSEAIDNIDEIKKFLENFKDSDNLYNFVVGKLNEVLEVIQLEAKRADTAEKAIASDLVREVNRATDKENELSGSIGTIDASLTKEVNRATTKENELAGNISSLSTNLSGEIQRSTTKDNELSNSITEESNRAIDRENEIEDKISNVETKIPTLVSQLENDSNYQTDEDVENAIIDKADIDELSNVIGEEVVDEDTLQDFEKLTRKQLKEDLFIDLWNSACGQWGKYDYENAPDKSKPFYLNELWLAYDMALKIYQVWQSCQGGSTYIDISNLTALKFTNLSTQIPFKKIVNVSNYINLPSWIIDYSNYINIRLYSENYNIHANGFNMPLTRCGTGLRKWLDEINIGGASNTSATTIQLASLVIGNNKVFHYFRFKNLNCNLKCNLFPGIDIDTFRYLITYRMASTSSTYNPVTITVHSDIYNALLGNATYPFNGGTQEEWEQLLQDAIDKDITFATV